LSDCVGSEWANGSAVLVERPVDKPAITYTPHPDATREAELNALAAIYNLVLFESSSSRKKATHPGGPDDVERRSDEIRARNIIPK
jgi:hypothetical protein